MPKVKLDAVTDSIARIFQALGVPREESALVSAHLVEAESAGMGSHGVIRVGQYVRAIEEGKIVPNAQLKTIRETTSTAALDGGGGFGQVMARRGMEKAIDIAGRTGVGVVTLVHCSHTGRLGSYTELAADAGMVGIAMVNAGGHGQWVAPHGGTAGRLSTNPMSIGVPSALGFPLILDMATSVAPEGKVRSLLTAGKPIPEGWIVKPDGNSTTNPADLYGPPRAALTPFGGYKGFGLSVLIDALAGGLSGAGCCHEADAPMEGKTDGVLLIAISVDAFLPREFFEAQIRAMANHVKSSPLVPGSAEILVPGELEARCKARAKHEGLLLNDALWSELAAIMRRLGIE